MTSTTTPGGRPPSPAASTSRWTVLSVGILAQAAMSALQQGLPALGPAVRQGFDLTYAEVGIVLASANWGVMLALLFWGALADRLGERQVVALGLGGSAAALVWAALASGIVELVVALTVAGGFGASAITASGRAVMGWFPRAERGFALGLRQMAVPLGGASAALTLPAIALYAGLEEALFALAAAAACGAVVAGIWLSPPPAQPYHARRADLPPPLKDGPMWRLAIASGLLVFAQIAFSAFVVLFLNEYRALPVTAAAGVLALVQVGGGIARIAAGRWSDRSGRRIPQMRGHGLALVATLLLTATLVDAPLALLLPVLVAAGVLTFSWNGLAFTAVTEMAGYARAGLALGLQGTVMRVVGAGAGVAFGAVVAATTWWVSFALLAVPPLLGCLLLATLVAEEHRRAEDGGT